MAQAARRTATPRRPPLAAEAVVEVIQARDRARTNAEASAERAARYRRQAEALDAVLDHVRPADG